MPASEVQICNLALSKVGAGRIAALTDGSVEARACLSAYEAVRDEVLEAFPWTFAVKRIALSRNLAAPVFGYAYSYALPADCIRVLQVDPLYGTDPVYDIEGRDLLTDMEEVNIRYIRRVTDTTVYGPSFVAALAMRLAVELAQSVARNAQMAKSMLEIYVARIGAMQVPDAVADSVDTTRTTVYTEARN